MESDSTPKIGLMIDQRPVGQLGLAKLSESEIFNEDTDYSDSEDETEDISEGGQVQAEPESAPAKRSSARIQLATQTGAFHKRTRYA